MNQSKSDGRKRSTRVIGLHMECEEDELSPAQIEYYEKARRNYEKFNKQLEEYNKVKHGDAVIEGEEITMFETLLESPPTPARNQQFTIIQLTGENLAGALPVAPRQNLILSPKAKQLPTLRAKPDAETPKTKATKIRKDGKLVITGENISETNCVGGLVYGNADPRNKVPCSISVIGDGDVETAISMTAGKTYPSLMCFARPRLNPKAGNISVNQSDRSVLDGQVKGLLMLPAPKFCEWLLQQGLLRKTQNCPLHPTQPMQLVQNVSKDPSKLVFSGGLVWYGDCCKMSKVVSVFHGSIFESSSHPPSVILKLIYHWACQTNIPNVLQWVKVDTMYVRNFYSLLRAVCVLSMNTKNERLGGVNKRIEVGSYNFRAKGNELQVVGVLDPETKRVRLRVMKCGKDLDSEIARFVASTTKRNSIICCDHSIDSSEIRKDFSHIDQHISCNKAIIIYLRETVSKFSPSSFPISRIVFQQFLEELAWRERWGPNSMTSFSSIIKHISDFTNETCGGGVIKNLIQVAADPFISKLPSDFTWPNSDSKIVTRKRSAGPEASTSSSAPKKKLIKDHAGEKSQLTSSNITPHYANFWRLQEASPDMSNEVMLYLKNSGHISVDGYYYGTLPGKTVLTEVAELTLKCTICQRVFFDCFNLTAHLILHYQDTPRITGPLQRISQCLDCFVGFVNPKDLISHAVHHNLANHLKRRACQICEQRFVSRSEFIFHMLQHHIAKELPYGCKICGYRSSSYSKIITHMKTHQWDSYLFCPYCLETVKIVSGRYQQLNIAYFAAHIRRHRVMDEEQCLRCKLRFVHPSLLKRHVTQDHISHEHVAGIEAFPDVSNCTIMAPPGNIAVPPIRQFEKPVVRKGYKLMPFPKTYKIGNKKRCVECEGFIDAKHFGGRVKCICCAYETHCEQAAREHYKLRHDVKNRLRVLFSKPVVTSDSMYCICGYQSSGDDLAAHLVKCNETTSYTSLTHTGKDELTVLNTVGLVRKSPEPVEKTKDEGIFTQSSESFLNIVSVESLSPSKKRSGPAATVRAEGNSCSVQEQDCYVVEVTGSEKNQQDDERPVETMEIESHVVEENTPPESDASQETTSITAGDDFEKIQSSDTATASSVEEILTSDTDTATSVEGILSSPLHSVPHVEMVVDEPRNVESMNDEQRAETIVIDKDMKSIENNSGCSKVTDIIEIEEEAMEVSIEDVQINDNEEVILSGLGAEILNKEMIESGKKSEEINLSNKEVDFEKMETTVETKEIENEPSSEITETASILTENSEPNLRNKEVDFEKMEATVETKEIENEPVAEITETASILTENSEPNLSNEEVDFEKMETTVETKEIESEPSAEITETSSILTETFEPLDTISADQIIVSDLVSIVDDKIDANTAENFPEIREETVDHKEIAANLLIENIDLAPTENIPEIISNATEIPNSEPSEENVGLTIAENISSLPECEKIQDKAVAGSLIDELEDIMSAAEQTAESRDFISE